MLRDLLVFAIVAAGLPYAFTRPFFGLMMFSWFAYMRPQDLCWGPARSFRFSFYIAIAMFAGFFLFEKRPFTRPFPQKKWIIGLGLFTTISLWCNDLYAPNYQITKWVDLLKVFAISMLTVGLTDSKKRLDQMMLVIACSLGFYGVKCGMFGVFAGGRILQGPGGMLKDNNDLSLALNMTIPLLYYCAHVAKDRRLRRVLYVAVFFTACAVIFTRSRGGFLTLVAIGSMLVWRSRRRALGFGAAAVVAVLFLAFLPSDVRARLATLKEPEKDGSAAGRLHAWSVAWRMSMDNPILGVGYQNFVFFFRRYDPTPEDEWQSGKKVKSVRVAHNSYLQLVAETGWPALICFLSMIGSTILVVWRIRWVVRARDGPMWAHHYATAIETSLVGFVLGATFLNRAHFDLLYHLVAMSAVVWIVLLKDLAARQPSVEPPKVDAWGKPLPEPALAASGGARDGADAVR